MFYRLITHLESPIIAIYDALSVSSRLALETARFVRAFAGTICCLNDGPWSVGLAIQATQVSTVNKPSTSVGIENLDFITTPP